MLARLGDTPIHCTFRERVTAGPGDTIRILPDMSLVHLFDSGTGQPHQPLTDDQENPGEPGMTLITRRNALQLGVGAAALSATGAFAPRAFAQSRVTAASATPPSLPIEKGATLAHAAPGALRRARRGHLPRQHRQLHQGDRRRGRASTSSAGRTSASRPRSPPIPAPAPTSIIGFGDEPHIYADKLVELSDVAEYLGKKYGGWMFLGEKYGKRHGTNNWIGLPFGGTAGPLVYRKSAVNAAGYEKPPTDLPGFLSSARS